MQRHRASEEAERPRGRRVVADGPLLELVNRHSEHPSDALGYLRDVHLRADETRTHLRHEVVLDVDELAPARLSRIPDSGECSVKVEGANEAHQFSLGAGTHPSVDYLEGAQTSPRIAVKTDELGEPASDRARHFKAAADTPDLKQEHPIRGELDWEGTVNGKLPKRQAAQGQAVPAQLAPVATNAWGYEVLEEFPHDQTEDTITVQSSVQERTDDRFRKPVLQFVSSNCTRDPTSLPQELKDGIYDIPYLRSFFLARVPKKWKGRVKGFFSEPSFYRSHYDYPYWRGYSATLKQCVLLTGPKTAELIIESLEAHCTHDSNQRGGGLFSLPPPSEDSFDEIKEYNFNRPDISHIRSKLARLRTKTAKTQAKTLSNDVLPPPSVYALFKIGCLLMSSSPCTHWLAIHIDWHQDRPMEIGWTWYHKGKYLTRSFIVKEFWEERQARDAKSNKLGFQYGTSAVWPLQQITTAFEKEIVTTAKTGFLITPEGGAESESSDEEMVLGTTKAYVKKDGWGGYRSVDAEDLADDEDEEVTKLRGGRPIVIVGYDLHIDLLFFNMHGVKHLTCLPNPGDPSPNKSICPSQMPREEPMKRWPNSDEPGRHVSFWFDLQELWWVKKMRRHAQSTIQCLCEALGVEYAETRSAGNISRCLMIAALALFQKDPPEYVLLTANPSAHRPLDDYSSPDSDDDPETKYWKSRRKRRKKDAVPQEPVIIEGADDGDDDIYDWL